ncbi:hypothetical protein N9H39_06845 [Gammaproteobacteria bacterium]|nr:hypothetical protein [Gammaproteobacteria bacterium]
MFREASKLAEARLRSLIILEGTISNLNASSMRRESLQGALITLTVYLGVTLLRSRDLQETARLMLYAARVPGELQIIA